MKTASKQHSFWSSNMEPHQRLKHRFDVNINGSPRRQETLRVYMTGPICRKGLAHWCSIAGGRRRGTWRHAKPSESEFEPWRAPRARRSATAPPPPLPNARARNPRRPLPRGRPTGSLVPLVPARTTRGGYSVANDSKAELRAAVLAEIGDARTSRNLKLEGYQLSGSALPLLGFAPGT